MQSIFYKSKKRMVPTDKCKNNYNALERIKESLNISNRILIFSPKLTDNLSYILPVRDMK